MSRYRSGDSGRSLGDRRSNRGSHNGACGDELAPDDGSWDVGSLDHCGSIGRGRPVDPVQIPYVVVIIGRVDGHRVLVRSVEVHRAENLGEAEGARHEL